MLNISAVTMGIDKLSLNRGVENNSTEVAVNATQKLMINDAGESRNTINVDERKKAVDPSNDLLNSCVFPNLIPTIAASESDILKTSKPIIAAFSLKINVASAAPITTHEAPVSLLYSMGRVNIAKKNIKIRLNTSI